jgi:hypothetical protein
VSSASALIRFPDGTIRHGIYHGTVDLMYEAIYPTLDDAWDNRKRLAVVECGCEPEDVDEVEIWSYYGFGTGWKAKTCQHKIHDQFTYWGIEDWEGNTIEPPCEHWDEKPAWVVEYEEAGPNE